MTEAQLATKVVAALNKLPNTFAWKNFGGAYGRSGVSDILCCHNGKFVAVELKKPDEYEDPYDGMTQNQISFAHKVLNADGCHICADSVETVLDELPQ